MRNIIKINNKYHIELFFICIEYEEVFHSVEIWVKLREPAKCGIDCRYNELIKKIYNIISFYKKADTKVTEKYTN